MGRLIGAVVVGFVVWTVLWLGGGAGLQAALPEGVDAETGAMVSTPMIVGALVLSAACSVAAGAACGAIARASAAPAWLAGALLAVGLGVELSSWDLAPAWYHVVFLVLLVPLTLAGAAITSRWKA